MLKSKPCQIDNISTSVTGKHGNAKCHIIGHDIFEGKRYEEIVPSTTTLTVPRVIFKQCYLVNIDQDGFLELHYDESIRTDLKAGDDIEYRNPSDRFGVKTIDAAGLKRLFEESGEPLR